VRESPSAPRFAQGRLRKKGPLPNIAPSLISPPSNVMPRACYVYVLASVSPELYISITNKLVRRLVWHRDGSDPYSHAGSATPPGDWCTWRRRARSRVSYGCLTHYQAPSRSHRLGPRPCGPPFAHNPRITYRVFAEALVHSVSPAHLTRQRCRTFLWAGLPAQHDQLNHDAELLCLASLVHDLGRTAPYRATRPGSHSFAIDGASVSRAFAAVACWDHVAFLSRAAARELMVLRPQ
jgi:hypothetical protein